MKECYWCKQELNEGIFETRHGMLRHFCSVHHIKRFFNVNYSKEEFESVKIFVANEENCKFLGMITEFYKYES